MKYEINIRITAKTKKDAIYWLRQFAKNIESRDWVDTGPTEGGTLGVSWRIDTRKIED